MTRLQASNPLLGLRLSFPWKIGPKQIDHPPWRRLGTTAGGRDQVKVTRLQPTADTELMVPNSGKVNSPVEVGGWGS